MKRLTICSTILVGILAGAVGCSRGGYLKRGKEAQKSGHFRVAEIFFRKEVQAHPRSAEAHYDLAEVLLQEGDYDLSYSELQRVLVFDPKNEQAQLALARLLVQSNRLDQARSYAQAVMSAHPQSLEAAMLLGDILSRRGQFDAARKQFQQVVKQHPGKAAGYSGLARVCISLGLRDEALKNLDTAIKVEPNATDAYVLKAKYLVILGETPEAISVLRAAIAANPKSGTAMLALGDALTANHQGDEANALWRKMAANGPDRQVACARLVLADLGSNKTAQAAKDLALVPTDAWNDSVPDLGYAKARLLLAQRRFAEAAKMLVELTRRTPRFAPGFIYLGSAYIGLGKYSDARNALETAEQLAPDVLGTQLLLASLAYNSHEFADAIQHAQHAIALDNKNVTGQMLLGDALLSDGKPDQAADAYRAVLRINPNLAIGHERVGRVAMLQNQSDVAIGELNQAVKLQPTLLIASQELTLVLWKIRGPKAALDRLRAQVELQPKASRPYFQALFGAYLVRDAQYQEAEEELQSAIKAQPKLIGAYLQLATVYEKTGKTGQTTAVLEAALKQQPNYLPVLMGLAGIADKQQDRKRAIAYYEKVLTADPGAALAANNLAWDYAVENENLEQALNLAQHARQLLPKDPNVADTLAFIMLKRGVPAAALPLLEESVAAQPDSATLHYHLGLARLALNQAAKAASEFNTALKLKPDSAEAGQINTSMAAANQELSRQRHASQGQVF